ncbi:hypothetical protein F5B17DRAFT_382132 [Nemania serpens]|nr:hypothetical protein F5B17DRAFT_382132 [Nemania serpens]
MGKSTSARWQGDISSSDLAKLMHGLIPETLENRWLIHADAADAQGKVAIHFCHSWTGAEIVHLSIPVSLNAAGSVDMNAPADKCRRLHGRATAKMRQRPSCWSEIFAVAPCFATSQISSESTVAGRRKGSFIMLQERRHGVVV